MAGVIASTLFTNPNVAMLALQSRLYLMSLHIFIYDPVETSSIILVMTKPGLRSVPSRPLVTFLSLLRLISL